MHVNTVRHRSFEQQQVEITRLNNIMRTAAGMALNK